MTPETIIQRLKSVGRSEHYWHIGWVLGVCAIIGSAFLLLISAAEWVFHASSDVRFFLWYAWVGAVAGSFGAMATPSIVRLVGLVPMSSPETIAMRVGEVYDDIRDTLSNALQLTSSNTETASSDLTQAAFEKSAAQTSGKDFSAIIDKKKTRLAMVWGLGAVGLTALLLFAVAPLGDALNRLVRHNESFIPEAPYQLRVSPIDETVMRGTSSQIEVEITGTAPPKVTLWIKEHNAERFTPFPVEIDTSQTVIHQLPGLTSSVAFYAEAQWYGEGVVSDTGRIRVMDRPLVRALSGRVIPPAYTHLPPTQITEQQADITALSGSVADLTITSNKPLKNATIVIEYPVDSVLVDTVVSVMEIDGPVARGRFSISRNGSYHVRLADNDGQENAEPVKYGIVALSDAYPTIAMVEPTKDVDIDATGLLPISVAISDDYGFSSLQLRYKLIRSRYAQPEEEYASVSLPITERATTLDVGYAWDLNEVGITPDDVYEFYLEIADNDIVGGPKTARTSNYRVRLPSLEEIFAETDEAQAEIESDLKELLKESEQVRREADELQREMQKQQAQNKQQMQWSDKKKAEDLAKKKEQLQKKMEEVTKKLEDMTDKLEQNNAMSEETLERYKELQELMKQVTSPELERMQKKMEEAMKDVTPEQMEKMMKDFKFDEEQFRKNIERTMNLLKRVQAEQKADELAKRAEELARKQDDLQKQANNTNANDKSAREKLSKQQERLNEDFDKLAKDAKELEELMKEIGQDMPTDMMKDAQEELDQESTSQDMQNAQQQMQQGEMQEASKNQQRASQNMQRFAQQMQQMGRQMRRNANKEAMKEMQRGMQDMLELSQQQEDLMQQMKNMDPSSQQFSEAARQQQMMQQSMQNMANSMMQLSQKSTAVSPELASDLGNALESMQNSMEQMQNRNGQKASQEQGNAMSAMNSAAQKMGDALGQMMSGEGQGQGGQGQQPGNGKGQGQSPFQRLQQLAEDQQGINNGTQQTGQQGGTGQQMNEQQRAEMGRLAAQQGKALKAMEELEQEQRTATGSKKPVGDLSQIKNDMQEVLSDMQTGLITPETRMRQERILSRLLNASRSMHERDYEKTRESRSGQDVRRQSPDPLNLGDGDTKSMRQVMDELRKGYTKDYQNLIRLYFEALQKRRLQEGVVE